MGQVSVLEVPSQSLANYGWLTNTSLPRIICEAVTMWREVDASASTLDSLMQGCEVERAVRIGHPIVLDPVPWSGRLMAVLASRARKTLPSAPLCALNWSKFGTEAGQPQLGDVLCYLLEDGPYVGLYLGEDDLAYHVLGADKTPRISVARVAKHRLYAARSPIYQDNSKSVRAIALNRDGSLRP